MKAFGKFLKDNGLSIAFWALFVLCLLGELFSGYFLQQHESRVAGHAASPWSYIASPDFLKGVFGNWQAALLQLFVLIVFAVFLRQRGASHSRKTEDEPKKDDDEQPRGLFPRTASWIYCNSLSVAFFVLFALSFSAFLLADFKNYGSQRQQLGEPPLTLGQFAFSAHFWFDVLQTWQAEFFAMGTFLILSIFLRQENSAESKPVWARDEDTGDTNE
ncbi:MAG: DUF6766 family protein [Sphingomonas sp.]